MDKTFCDSCKQEKTDKNTWQRSDRITVPITTKPWLKDYTVDVEISVHNDYNWICKNCQLSAVSAYLKKQFLANLLPNKIKVGKSKSKAKKPRK
jgi:hypothetical protein